MSTRQARRRQQRTSQRRGRPARRTQTPWYFGPWGLSSAVLAIIVVVVIIVEVGGNKAQAAVYNPRPVPASVLNAVTAAPLSTIEVVGSGGEPDPWTAVPAPLPQRLTSGGKPELLYMGAEYCPYCAGERWAMINALSRFGRVTGLRLMKSSSTDVWPSTNTFTTRDAHYASRYLKFDSVEEFNSTGKGVLQIPTSEQSTLLNTYGGGGFPFIDLGNRAVSGVGTQLPDVLHANPADNGSGPLAWLTIANDLAIPTSAPAKAIIGNANWLTAGICRMTKNRPASVCATPTISSLEAQLSFHR